MRYINFAKNNETNYLFIYCMARTAQRALEALPLPQDALLNGNLRENLMKLKIIVIIIREFINSWKAYNSITKKFFKKIR